MSSYYVRPPQELCRGTFIVSVGSGVAYWHGPFKLAKVLVHRGAEKGLETHSFIFEGEGNIYECSPTLPLDEDGRLRAKLKDRLVEAPRALWPFCHPDTVVLYV